MSMAIRNVQKHYGSLAVLKDVNLAIDEGDLLVLLGPSGCGKSTLLSLIAGLSDITHGTISIAGKVVNDVPPKDRDIAMVFQSYALYPSMSVRKNLTFGLETRGVPKEKRNALVAKVASLLQIDKLLERKPSQLSGGQRQRVAIGRALVREPVMFLFDEPLSNLDAKLRVEMRTEIKRLHQRLGTTMVYVTHDQIEAMTLATKIAIMNQGVVQQFGTPQEIYERPANVFVAAFVGSPPMNLIPATVVKNAGRLHGRIPLDNADDVVVPLPEGLSDAGLAEGGEIIVGLRPESFSDKPHHPEEHEYVELALVPSVVEPTGPDDLVIVRMSDKDTVIRMRPGVCKSGIKRSICVDVGKMAVFDAASGRNLLLDPEAGLSSRRDHQPAAGAI